MARDYESEEYNNLISRKADNETQQRSCQADIDCIENKIERLRRAYDTIDAAKESIDDIKGSQKNMCGFYESQWKGSRAQYFYGMCESGDLYKSYDGYVSNIDDTEDAINWEINKLQEEKNKKYGILAGLINQWNDLCTRIQNFFN